MNDRMPLADSAITDQQEHAWVIVKQRKGQDVFVEMQSDIGGCGTGHCGAGAVGCQSNAFVGLFASAPLLKLKNVPMNVTTGDLLQLSLPRAAVLQLAFVGYGIPLLLFLLGLWGGQVVAGDLGAFTLGLSGLLIAWFLIGKLGLVVEPRIVDVQSTVVKE